MYTLFTFDICLQCLGIYFEHDTRNCSVFAFTKSWLELSIPDWVVTQDNFSIYWLDRTENLGKS